MPQLSPPTDWTAGSGQKLYEQAKGRIPGGTQLLSKRPELFLPGQWPAYYSKAKGCKVWDLDGREFYDFTSLSVGACLLGYADDDVDAAVKDRIERGSMSTLNSPDELALADLLCELHPWAQAVRYARTGGESMAVAVRIARAHTGKDVVAFCGYHGWHDWYLSANLAGDQALDGHLLPGLEPAGVPRPLAGTARPFAYNQIDDLHRIVADCGDNLAAIITEPTRSEQPKDGFLGKMRAVADKTGAVLIFDEISAGWRFATGGAHLVFGVEPDMAVFAKAISNGYPMAAIIGRQPVMEAAQTSFISSTYWTDGIGPAAALAAIKKNRDHNVPAHLGDIGQRVQNGWRAAADKTGLKITVSGHRPVSHFALDYGPLAQALSTLFTQEMLDRGYLAAKGLYVSYAHTPPLVDAYLAAVTEAFEVLARAAEKNDVENRLRGPVAHTGFQRLVQ